MQNMQTHRLLFSVLVLAVTLLTVGSFLDSPAPTLAQSFNPTTSEQGVTSVITTTTPLPTTTGTATVTVTSTSVNTATVTATATEPTTTTVTATATEVTTPSPTASATPSSRDTYLALIQRAANPTATPTVTPSPTPEPRCTAYFDDFSNPNSGWPVGENQSVRVNYINGEYSFATREDGIYTLRSPAGAFNAYTLEADIRWSGSLGDSYGLAYGIAPDFSSYYIFDMNTEVRQFRVLRIQGQSATVIVALTDSDAIVGGDGTNQLGIRVNESSQVFTINGVQVATANQSIGAGRSIGIVVGANASDPSVEARFDNYCVTAPAGSGTLSAGDKESVTIQALEIPGFME